MGVGIEEGLRDMACGSCGGGLPQNDYQVTYKDGTTKTFTVSDGGYATARSLAARRVAVRASVPETRARA